MLAPTCSHIEGTAFYLTHIAIQCIREALISVEKYRKFGCYVYPRVYENFSGVCPNEQIMY